MFTYVFKCVNTYIRMYMYVQCIINMERFAGLCAFCSFQEYHERFSLNISNYIYTVMEFLNVKHHESFPMKTSLG